MREYDLVGCSFLIGSHEELHILVHKMESLFRVWCNSQAHTVMETSASRHDVSENFLGTTRDLQNMLHRKMKLNEDTMVFDLSPSTLAVVDEQL